jgi:serine phosphatase RsbU (regulator of sigma subunit)
VTGSPRTCSADCGRPSLPYVAAPRHLGRLRRFRRGNGDRWRPLRHPACANGCWVLIGDVTGKGSVAAAVSVALRHSARALARHVDSPQELLFHLNEMLLEGKGRNDFATALLLRLQRRRR